MQGVHDYIIENKKAFNETFKTEGGIELYGDKRFLYAKLANRIATVVNIPVFGETVLKAGYQVMIDPTIYYSQHYEKTGKGDNGYLQDREKGLYKIPPNMIVLYRETFNDEWKGFGENIMVEFQLTPEQKNETSLILQHVKREFIPGVAKVKYDNPELNDMGAHIGDTVAIRKNLGVSFFFESKEFFWLRNRDVLAVINPN